MGVEIILHKDDFPGPCKMGIGQIFQNMGIISGALLP